MFRVRHSLSRTILYALLSELRKACDRMMFGMTDECRLAWEMVMAFERDRARRSPIDYARTKRKGRKKSRKKGVK